VPQTESRIVGEKRILAVVAALKARLSGGRTAIFIGQFGALFLRLLLMIVFSRILGPHEMGVYVAMIAVVQILARGCDFGLQHSLVYHLRHDRGTLAKGYLIAIAHCVIVFPLLVTLVILTRYLPFHDAAIKYLFVVRWGAISILVVFTLLNSVAIQLLIPCDAHRRYAVFTLLAPLISLLICVYLAQMPVVTVVQSIWATLAGEFTAAVVGFFFILSLPQMRLKAQNALSLRRTYSYALRLYPGTLVKFIGQRLDRLILATLLPASAVAIYGLATSVRDNLLLPLNIYALIAAVEIVDRFKQPSGVAAALAFVKSEIRLWSLLMGSLCVVMFAAIPWGAPLIFGHRYAGLELAIQLSLPAVFCLSISTICWTFALAGGRPGIGSIGWIATTIVGLALVWAGAWFAGVNGALIGGSLTSALAMLGWLGWFYGPAERQIRASAENRDIRTSL
jgi:O-antigen/teichoic acid export membrane protein